MPLLENVPAKTFKFVKNLTEINVYVCFILMILMQIVDKNRTRFSSSINYLNQEAHLSRYFRNGNFQNCNITMHGNFFT